MADSILERIAHRVRVPQPLESSTTGSPTTESPTAESPTAESRTEITETVVVEAPLTMQVDCNTVAVTMRTPGHDEALVIGFLVAEGVIEERDDVLRVQLTQPEDASDVADQVGLANVLLQPSVVGERLSGMAERRGTLVSSACGVCGRDTIDDLLTRSAPLADGPEVTGVQILSAVSALSKQQPVFDVTGGLHAAALFDERDELLTCHEDIGRHNAVDKSVGRLWLDGQLERASLMVVSGRAGFEIAQKAAVARIPVVASISAASSLAIEVAEAMNITLVGFAREGKFTVYTGGQRVRLD